MTKSKTTEDFKRQMASFEIYDLGDLICFLEGEPGNIYLKGRLLNLLRNWAETLNDELPISLLSYWRCHESHWNDARCQSLRQLRESITPHPIAVVELDFKSADFNHQVALGEAVAIEWAYKKITAYCEAKGIDHETLNLRLRDGSTKRSHVIAYMRSISDSKDLQIFDGMEFCRMIEDHAEEKADYGTPNLAPTASLLDLVRKFPVDGVPPESTVTDLQSSRGTVGMKSGAQWVFANWELLIPVEECDSKPARWISEQLASRWGIMIDERTVRNYRNDQGVFRKKTGC